METNGERLTGKITRINQPEGWGFIVSKDKEHIRFYFRWTNLLHTTKKFPELTPGMKVEFTPYDTGEKGWHAKKIKILES